VFELAADGVAVKFGKSVELVVLAILAWAHASAVWAQGPSYPEDGATDVPTTVQFVWPATENATSYYLYIGTAPRIRDVVNTGDIPAPSYVADRLPASKTLHATFWAKVDGKWIGTGSVSFTTSDVEAPSALAELLTPGPEYEAIPRTLTFTWKPADGATAYYLYVGNSPGTRDVGNSGETTATSFRVSNMPLDKPVYVRLWTKLSGTWRYRDYRYLVLGNATALTRPVGGDTKTDPATHFEWHRLYGITCYYLYVGSAPGKKDIINSGETQKTSWPNTPLAGGTTYYVRLHTKTAGTWYSRDYTIRTDDISLLTSPKDMQGRVDPATGFTWMPVVDAQKYYLYVGSTPGARDVVNGGETTQLKLASRALPGGVPLYARMWVLKGGAWRYRDSVFTTRASPRFIYPKPGQVGVNGSVDFKWTPVAGVQSYTLSVGTTAGDDDVVPATTTSETELSVTDLPLSLALYATVTARVDDENVAGQTVFTTNPTSSAARVLAPLDGGLLPAGTSIKWRPAVLARAYRLEIGSAPDMADLLDSGEIRVTERFVEHVPIGVPLHARLTTYFLSGSTYQQTFTFVKEANAFPVELRHAEAERATAFIRNQSFGNLPVPTGLLADQVRQNGKDFANCVDYGEALVRALKEIDLQLNARIGAACLVPNAYDCHTYTEIEDESTREWFVLDPTFGIAARRASDLAYATAADISAATREAQWDAIEYAALTPAGFAYAETYYIDYPLMFFHVYEPNLATLKTIDESVLHLYERVAIPLDSEQPVSVSVRCNQDQNEATVSVGGAEQQVLCSGTDNLSQLFPAKVVTPVGDGQEAIELYRASRFAFPSD
jgi:hypothetical protein